MDTRQQLMRLEKLTLEVQEITDKLRKTHDAFDMKGKVMIGQMHHSVPYFINNIKVLYNRIKTT